ncbi:methylthioribulose 1-phosphate dehydratase [Paenibacillus chitinolyticus]|uniref:methylthioribulose 1-phosphate dehydratase n=1 Tax=Paenibacillus chitinolyticus TaxID=79263 RepID=UPI0026E4C183|nr:methylthioribulose 1-phosphate dehydratase [Paenibacillus chitinolyticus]GKS13894.1 methylthioribulose-1-phosphate dehydratase [Paenibacillus chitinolyticus]
MTELTLEQKQHAYDELREIKANLAARGWFPATSGNLSVRVGEFTPENFTFAVTSSGKDKSLQSPEDFLLVNEKGTPVEATRLKPSAETLIHCEIYKYTGAGAILHVHTMFNNLASELYGEEGFIPVEGIEIIKALNIWEEDATIRIPVLPNYADIPKIAELVQDAIVPRIPGIVLRKHGIYAWGASVAEAKRHLEAFEFMFEYVYRWHLLKK